MKIAVIIPCYNSEENIASALQSLATQEVLPDEVILIDNGSTDNTVKRIDEFMKGHFGLNIILTTESKKGPAAARNQGIKVSKADAVLFMDSDCIADKEWVKNIIELFRDDSVIAIGGVTSIYRPINPVEKLQAIDELCFHKVSPRQKSKNDFLLGNFPVTNNAAYRIDPINRIGGFDESYLCGEDADLYLRLITKLNTFECILTRQQRIKMWHRPRKTLPKLIKQIFLYRVALARLVKAHSKGKIIIKLPFFGLFEIDSPFLTIWVNTPILVSIIFLLLCIILQNIIIYLILAAFIFFFIDTYRRTKKVGLTETCLGIVSIWLVSLVKKVISELGRVYGSIKYRIISI